MMSVPRSNVSTIDELPPGRTPVVTKLFAEDKRDAAIVRLRENDVTVLTEQLKARTKQRLMVHAKGVSDDLLSTVRGLPGVVQAAGTLLTDEVDLTGRSGPFTLRVRIVVPDALLALADDRDETLIGGTE